MGVLITPLRKCSKNQPGLTCERSKVMEDVDVNTLSRASRFDALRIPPVVLNHSVRLYISLALWRRLMVEPIPLREKVRMH